MDTPKPRSFLAELSACIHRRVNTGFLSPQAILSDALDVCCDDADPQTLYRLAEPLIQEAVAAQRLAEASWPAVTDCDRLDAALAELNRSGIVSRQDFTCRCTCGLAEMDDEIAAEAEAGVSVRGYAFYHQQDTDAAAAGCGLYLFFGGLDGEEATSLRIGREMVEVLERHGLSTQWGGTKQTRLFVDLDWKRCLPADPVS